MPWLLPPVFPCLCANKKNACRNTADSQLKEEARLGKGESKPRDLQAGAKIF
jgi:hypothetical protein